MYKFRTHFHKVYLVALFLFILFSVSAQQKISNFQNDLFWNINNDKSITWSLVHENRLPHDDNIEMSGEYVAAIIRYAVDEKKHLHVKRNIIFPQLRKFIKTSDPDYSKYRAYLQDEYTDDLLPVITTGQYILGRAKLDSVNINGKITFYHHPENGLKIVRTLLPSMRSRLFVEKWTILNVTDTTKNLKIGGTTFQQEETGVYGNYKRKIFCDAKRDMAIPPSGQYTFGIYFSATLNDEPGLSETISETERLRMSFIDTISNNFVLDTPDSLLNTLFYFSKIRAAESIFQTKMGLVHSPGGGRYYAGVWANDQAEYSGPFFPYLGYKNGVEAAMNAYRMFLKNIPEGDGKIWASFEMNGELPCCSQDRGDAAMIAFGATHFLLASGNRGYAEELWPLISWCLEYCEKKKTKEGVIASESDELEGRFPSGSANLSTSSLYYGALKNAVFLVKAMGENKKSALEYEQRAKELSRAIETYFGAKIDGLYTYKYYKENNTLRSWICLPLVVGINARKEGTLDALFSQLWTDNGVRIEKKDGSSKETEVFWDRGTLYSFRGAFKAGAADRALEKLKPFSKTRLIGFHVPYVVEAWPEGDMAHLSAESALYCRIFTEGILGLEPTGFNSFTLQPHLPGEWKNYSIKNIAAFNSVFDISVVKEENMLNVSIIQNGKAIIKKKLKRGEKIIVQL